ncbi:MAG: Gfo/Idh/MocA family oxidoreductase [Kiritimatiellae bacterium]|nr:Gfo/Idh/MocA family oxidoreductase [Kiritimatiellia bacterium]
MTTRRKFISGAAMSGCAAVFPNIFSAGCATGYRANETVQIAAIGAANRAAADIRGLAGAGGRIVGLCDVDTRFAGPVRAEFPSAPFFGDWRRMLDELDRDIDAVMIGVPDHWHATMAIECLERGKHVQCEKPLCQSFHEMDAMVEAAKRHPDRVTQAMNQGHAYDSIRDFREIVEAGMIGEVDEAHVWCPAVYSFLGELEAMKSERDAVPDGLDWERWQGPVPRREYNHRYLPGIWRFWTMYGCNTLGDWSCHLMDPLFWTFGLDLPESVETELFGRPWDPLLHGATFPEGVKTTFRYVKRDGRPFTLVWYDGVACREVPKPAQWEGEDEMFPPYNSGKLLPTRDWMANGAFVYGSSGTIEYGHHGANYLRILPDTTPEKLAADGAKPAEKYARIPGERADDKPFNEFIEAIRRGSKAGSDFAYAGAMTRCSLLGVAALFDSGRKLVFDREKKVFENSAAANARLRLERIGA